MFNGRPGKALADQLAIVSKRRLLNPGGRLTDAEMRDVERAIKIQLALL